MKLSILIPVLNYEERLEKTIRKIKQIVKNQEIIILYDVTNLDMKKKAIEISRILKRKYKTKTIFRFNEKGFGSALRKGFEIAKGDFIVVMMGDFSDDPNTIPKMIEKAREGYDIVVGSRYMKGGRIIGNTLKQRISHLFSLLINIFSKVKCRDITNAFKLYKKDVLKTVKTKSKSFDISCEITLKAARKGFKISEVPTIWKNRVFGKSNFKMIKESKNYFKWFLFSVFIMPSKITKIIVLLLFLFFLYLIII
ncbi:MAG: glycosyltransferase [Candidatus Aenigmatarchaeota archaeon]